MLGTILLILLVIILIGALPTWLSLLKKLFGVVIGRPTIATGNSLPGQWSLGHGRDLAIMDGLWASAY